MIPAVIINILMYLGAAVLFFTGYGILALILFLLAALLSYILSGGKIELFDVLD